MKIVTKTLDELGCVQRGKSKHRPRDAAYLYDGPYPFIQTSDVKNAGLYISEYTQTYSAAGLAQSKLWESGTLCITIAANIADTAILSFDACFPDSIIGFIPDQKKSDARYIKYLFDAVLQQRFKKFTQGATQDNLSKEKLLSIKLPLAEDVNEQRVIADILSSYDDLIDTNRHRIQLLEESARLLFREWFVYFRFPLRRSLSRTKSRGSGQAGHDPVRKSNSNGVKIVDGVPEGWKRGTVQDISKVKSGYAFNSKDWLDEGNPVIKIGNIKGDGTVNLDDCSCIDLNVASKTKDFALKKGDLLIAMTGATVGKVGLLSENSKTAYLNQRVGKFVPKFEGAELVLYYFFMSITAQNHITNYAVGAAQPNISACQIESIKIIVATGDIYTQFIKLVEPMFKEILNLRNQNQKLAQARDLLLPRLMSGAIDPVRYDKLSNGVEV